MTILIIGSEGFIGRSLIHHFTGKCDVIGCDLLDSRNLQYPYYKISRLSPDYKEIFKQEKIDVCINAAGSGSVPDSITNPLNDFEANCLDCLRILESIRTLSSPTRYLYISSAAVYGNPKELPVKEESEISPMSPYGWHKYYGELMCKEYSALYNLKTCIIRPFSVYGPGLRKQLLWDLFLKSKKSNHIELFGTGKETRDFIFIDDFVHAIQAVVNQCDFKAHVYNIANGTEVTMQEVVSCYLQESGKNVTHSFNNKVRGGDPVNWKADITKLQQLGYKQTVSLTQGIVRTLSWQKEYGLV